MWKLPAAREPSCWWPALWSAACLLLRAHQSEAWSCPSPTQTNRVVIQAQCVSPQKTKQLMIFPLDGSILSLMVKIRGIQTPNDASNNELFCQHWWVIFRDHSSSPVLSSDNTSYITLYGPELQFTSRCTKHDTHPCLVVTVHHTLQSNLSWSCPTATSSKAATSTPG